jgi:hypothetical protein
MITDTKILSFAGKLKELATELFGMEDKDRKLLQDLGGKMREINEDVWLNYTINESLHHENVVIDDLRLPNEYNKLKEAGFTIVRLEIDRETQIKRLIHLYPNSWKSQVERLDHFTEIALNDYEFDYTIKHTDDVITKIKEIVELSI